MVEMQSPISASRSQGSTYASDLSSEMQQRLDSVLNSLSPERREALQAALQREPLTNYSAEERAQLIDQLNYLKNSPLQPALLGQNQEVLDSVVDAITKFASIHQGLTSNCTVATFSVQACRENPLLYVTAVSELARTGQTQLAGGETLTLYEGTFDVDASQHNFHGRSLSNRIFQDSAMQFCHQITQTGDVDSGWHYDARTRTAMSPSGQEQAGLYPFQFQAFYHSFFDRATDRIDTVALNGNVSGAELLDRILAEAREKGRLIPVEIRLGEMHEVSVEGLVYENGEPRIKIRNTWEHMGTRLASSRQEGYDEHGRYETFSVEEFQSILLSAMLESESQTIHDSNGKLMVTDLGARATISVPKVMLDNREITFIHGNPEDYALPEPDLEVAGTSTSYVPSELDFEVADSPIMEMLDESVETEHGQLSNQEDANHNQPHADGKMIDEGLRKIRRGPFDDYDPLLELYGIK